MKKNFLIFLLLTACSATAPRCEYIGCEYLGAKYASDPLGEGYGYDTDPLIRDDAFDCTTFVETSLAGGDVDKLTMIRYQKGEVHFLNRNHFMEYNWLVNNSNLVENVSQDYGKTAVRTAKLERNNWFKKTHNIDNAGFQDITVQIMYIPYSEWKPIETDQELVVLFIIDNPKMRDNMGTDLAVSHMGFLLPNRKLRHASSKSESVVDVDFAEYVQARKTNKNNLGFALYKIKND
ncbi:MAG: DUF1460 domain-containing protein [Rickettsiales bacterium]|jgi:hypothetical protein|nr:DUF1460 domain-containing protein [Rickettsiales bacterium]